MSLLRTSVFKSVELLKILLFHDMWVKNKTAIIICGALVLVIVGGVVQDNLASKPTLVSMSPPPPGVQVVSQINGANNGSDNFGCFTQPFTVSNASWEINWTIQNNVAPMASFPNGLASELDLIPLNSQTGDPEGQSSTILTPFPTPLIAYGESESNTYSGTGTGSYELRLDSADCQNGSMKIEATVSE